MVERGTTLAALVQVGRNIPTVGSNDFSRWQRCGTTEVVTTNPCYTYAKVY